MFDKTKILIIQTAFIGDAVLALALSEEIKRINQFSEIHFLVTPISSPLLEHAPSVVRVHTFDKYGAEAGRAGIKSVADTLNRENFDVVISLHESRRTAKVLSLLHANVKIGASSARHLAPYLTHKYPIPSQGRMTERIIEFARYFSDTINHSTLPKLIFDSTLVPQELTNCTDIVVLAPGSAWNTKKWHEGGFTSVGRELAKTGKTIVVIGTKDDSEIGERIVNHIGSGAYNYAGKIDIVGAAAIISVSQLVIGCDSAPIHVATACGVKSLEIMGPTIQEFGFTPPPDLGRIVEQKGLWCRPCDSHGGDMCPIYTHDCMKTISSEIVIEAALNQLADVVS